MYFKSYLQSLSYARFFPPRDLISYVGGPCSSGKTRHACDYIKERIYETNYIYVAPSNRLAEQTAADLRARGLNVLVINSASYPGNVRRQIIKEMSLFRKTSGWRRSALSSIPLFGWNHSSAPGCADA